MIPATINQYPARSALAMPGVIRQVSRLIDRL